MGESAQCSFDVQRFCIAHHITPGECKFSSSSFFVEYGNGNTKIYKCNV